MNIKPELYLYKQKLCSTLSCNKNPLKKRKNKPLTATKEGCLFFDYYQCSRCKTNYAYKKNK